MAIEEEILVRAQMLDDLSGPLRRIELQADRTNAALERMSQSSVGVGRNMTAATRSTSALSTAMRSAENIAGITGRALTQTTGYVIQGFLGATTAAIGFGLKSASSFQQAQNSFGVLLGSATEGKALFQQLADLNLESPFDQDALDKTAQSLLSLGVAKDKVFATTASLSNIASATSNPAGSLSSLGIEVGQLKATERINGIDLTQLAMAGVPLDAALKEAYGVTQGQARDLSAKGQPLDSQKLLDLFANPNSELNKKYANAAEQANNTIGGQFSNIKAVVQTGLADAFMDPKILQSLKDLVPALKSFVAEAAPKLASIFSRLVEIGTNALPKMGPRILEVLDGLNQMLDVKGADSFVTKLFADDGLIAVGTHLMLALLPVLPAFLTALTPVLTTVGDLLTKLLEHPAAVKALAEGLAGAAVLGGLFKFIKALRWMRDVLREIAVLLGMVEKAKPPGVPGLPPGAHRPGATPNSPTGSPLTRAERKAAEEAAKGSKLLRPLKFLGKWLGSPLTRAERKAAEEAAKGLKLLRPLKFLGKWLGPIGLGIDVYDAFTDPNHDARVAELMKGKSNNAFNRFQYGLQANVNSGVASATFGYSDKFLRATGISDYGRVPKARGDANVSIGSVTINNPKDTIDVRRAFNAHITEQARRNGF